MNDCIYYYQPNCKCKLISFSVCPFYTTKGDLHYYVECCKGYTDSGGYAVFKDDKQVSIWFDTKYKADQCKGMIIGKCEVRAKYEVSNEV